MGRDSLLHDNRLERQLDKGRCAERLVGNIAEQQGGQNFCKRSVVAQNVYEVHLSADRDRGGKAAVNKPCKCGVFA